MVDALNDAAIIVCSSGTTGLPKGVCSSHTALLESMASFGINSTYVMLCFSSLYWASGTTTLFRGTLSGATRIITTEGFSPELQLQLILKYKITYFLNAPHQLSLLMKCDRFHKTDLSSIRHVLIGGSRVPLHLKCELSEHLPNGEVIVIYGLTETTGAIAYDLPLTKDKDTVGRLKTGYTFKIIDYDGNRCGPNTDGEVCVKMAYNFIGYYNNQKATDEVFDEEGFILTGDVGYFDEDGNLFIVDRKKDILKYYNFHVSPSEVESFLTKSSDIKAAYIVGIRDSMGDLPAAVIVRNDQSNISKKDVYDLVANHFADHYKLRGGVYFVDSLPTTPSGKVLRRKVKELIATLFDGNQR